MSDPRLAAIGAHHDTGLGDCTCGWSDGDKSHAEHLLDAIDAADAAAGIVRLRDPSATDGPDAP